MWIYILQYVMCVSNGIHCKKKNDAAQVDAILAARIFKFCSFLAAFGRPLSPTSAVTDHCTPLPGALPCCWATWRGYKRFARHQCGVSYLHIQWMQRGLKLYLGRCMSAYIYITMEGTAIQRSYPPVVQHGNWRLHPLKQKTLLQHGMVFNMIQLFSCSSLCSLEWEWGEKDSGERERERRDHLPASHVINGNRSQVVTEHVGMVGVWNPATPKDKT